MRRRKHAPLPELLSYLQPFVDALAKLHPDDVNEDVDPAPLEELIRQRIKGVSLNAVRTTLEADRNLLEMWLRELGDRMHPAYWVLGFLAHGDVAAGLRAPAKPATAWPAIAFDAPPGWEFTVAQNALSLKKRKLTAKITVIDELTNQLMLRQMQFVPPMLPSGHELRSQTVEFGECSGTKFLVMKPFKKVDYLLRIPGGFVSIMLTGIGVDFDETEFESQLHTLQVSGANEYFDSIRPWGR